MAAEGGDTNGLAALVGAFGGILATLIGSRVKRQLSRDDAQARGLSAQLDGWGEFSDRLEKRMEKLEKENGELRDEDATLSRRVIECETDRKQLNRRVSELERRQPSG